VKRLKVSLSDDVKMQIREQVLYIASDSVDNALAWEDRLRAAINGLAAFSGHPIDENATPRVNAVVHKMVFERTYLVHYHINESAGVVEVVNFRHGAKLPRRGEP
jgi:plasmid stabilization system protein ParE